MGGVPDQHLIAIAEGKVHVGNDGGCVFNVSTAGLTSGTYSLQFTLTGDPVTHSVEFRVK